MGFGNAGGYNIEHREEPANCKIASKRAPYKVYLNVTSDSESAGPSTTPLAVAHSGVGLRARLQWHIRGSQHCERVPGARMALGLHGAGVASPWRPYDTLRPLANSLAIAATGFLRADVAFSKRFVRDRPNVSRTRHFLILVAGAPAANSIQPS